MEIDEKTVRHVAKLARLELTEKEVKTFQKDMNNVLESFNVLSDVEAEPSFQPMHMENVFRKDDVEKSLSQGEALLNTKHKEKGFFKGPKAI